VRLIARGAARGEHRQSMLNAARTQTTPVDEPAEQAGENPAATPRPRSTVARIEHARDRALALAPRAPGYEHAIGALRHDQRHGGGLLAGALAFRLFGALLPLALLVAVILGYATTLDRSTPKQAGEAIGIGPTVLESIAESAKLSSGTRWSVCIFAVLALLLSANSAARAIRAVHSLAWEGRVGRFRRPLPAALVLLAAMAAIALVIAVAGRARAEFGVLGLLFSVVAFIAFVAIWLVVARLLPHGDADWAALLPGAVVFALGIQVIHLGTVLLIAEKIQRASETYGSLGVAFTLLFWLFVISRVIVASAMLNAALAERRRSPHGRFVNA
jgi:membrane protein